MVYNIPYIYLNIRVHGEVDGLKSSKKMRNRNFRFKGHFQSDQLYLTMKGSPDNDIGH